MNYNYLDSYVKLFNNAINNNRLSHLYLISGPSGSGKKTLAYKISSLLLNEDEDKLLTSGHINLYYIKPDGQNIRARQIDLLQAEFFKTSLVKGYRIYIIDEVEKLNQTSANRLLKFLEEPVSKKTIGFLLTNNSSQVITTITSRSQQITLPSILENKLTNILKDKGFDLLSAELLPYLNQNIETLNELYEDPNIKLLVEKFNNYVNALIKEDNMWIYAESELKDIRYNKTLTHYFLQFLLIFYLDIFKIKNNEDVQITSFFHIYEQMKVIKTEILAKRLKSIQDLLEKINYNVNIDMAFSQLLLHIE